MQILISQRPTFPNSFYLTCVHTSEKIYWEFLIEILLLALGHFFVRLARKERSVV